MDKNEVLLETYPLQKDLRIRLPKQILSNMPIEIGTMFDIYINLTKKEIVLRINKSLTNVEVQDV